MKHDEMVDLLDSLENAKDALMGIEHAKAVGHQISNLDMRLFVALRKFIASWRSVSTDTVKAIVGEKT